MPIIKKTALFDINAIFHKMDISEKQAVAELGCGNFGFFVFPLAGLVGKQGKVYAVDIMRSTLEEIEREAKKENLTQIKTIWSDLEVFKGAKIETSSLDGAMLINVLHQTKQRTSVIREAVRLLKRGGKLLIVEWNNSDLPFGPEIDRRVKLESLKTAAPKLGLSVTEEFEAGPYHYGLILNKL